MSVEPPDPRAAEQARTRQSMLTKPAGALGRLEDLSVWLASVQGCCPPHAPRRPRVIVVAGDHGVALAGVSAYPREVTGQMVANFLAGGAAVNVLAAAFGATVRVLDIAVDGEIPVPADRLPADLTRWKIRRGSGRLDIEDALSTAQARRAIEAGTEIADDEIDGGADLLIPGDMGIGNTTAAAVLTGALTGRSAADVTGRGTGVDDAAFDGKQAIVAAGLERALPHRGDPQALLATVGGADIGVLAGMLAQAARRRTPVLLDGVVTGAAALLAEELTPGARAWWAAGHRSTEPAHGIALRHLGLTPLVDLGLRLGEGTGALLALPLLRAAADILADMATFEEAGVSDRA